MKTTLITLIALLSLQSYARDMSRTETYDEAYKEQADGSSLYVGGCSLHQDYEGKKFIVTKTLVESFEPREYSELGLMRKFRGVEKELIAAVGGLPYIADTDDITLEKIEHKKLKKLDLYRFNIGVGGGNGYYEVYEKTKINGTVKFEKLSNVFDGDVEFCDSKVWKL